MPGFLKNYQNKN